MSQAEKTAVNKSREGDEHEAGRPFACFGIFPVPAFLKLHVTSHRYHLGNTEQLLLLLKTKGLI